MSDFTFLLPDGMAPWLAVTLIGASFFTSLLSAAAGIGGGSVMFAILALVLPPAALVPVHGVLQLGSNLSRVVLLRDHIRPVAFSTFAVSSLIGATIGGLIAVRISPEVMLIFFALFILWMAWGRIPEILQKIGLFAGGAVSSVLTMFVGATGPFVAAVLKPLNFDRLTFVSVHSACMSIQHTLKLLVFGLLGFAFGSYLFLMGAMLTTGFAGTMVGKRILVRVGDERFHRVLNIILTLIALRILWSAATSLLGPDGGG